MYKHSLIVLTLSYYNFLKKELILKNVQLHYWRGVNTIHVMSRLNIVCATFYTNLKINVTNNFATQNLK